MFTFFRRILVDKKSILNIRVEFREDELESHAIYRYIILLTFAYFGTD